MGKLDIFEMKLENSGPFLSGSTISGDVLLRIKKDIDIARLMVYLFGGGQVEFQETLGNTAASRATFEDHETYVNLAQMVYSKSTSHTGPIRRICRNEVYKFKFEFEIPSQLPSSFMTVIYYRLTAFLDCGGKSHEVSVPLVVISDLDLNRYRGRLQLERPIDSWSPVRNRTDTGLVSAHLVANKRGYAIGETIRMQIEIFNNSRTKLENLNACLVQKGTLKAHGAGGLQWRRVQRLLVRHISLGKLRNAERLVIDDASIPLPWVVTSEMHNHTRLIEIEYYLQLTSSTQLISALTGAPLSQTVCIGPDFRKSEMVSVLAEEQIAIGTRPLRDQQQATPESDLEQMDQSLGEEAGAAAAAAPAAATPAAAAAAAAAAAPQALPTAPPAADCDLTMFTMLPSAPPSYDEAMTHEKAPLVDQGGSPTASNGSPAQEMR